MAGGNGTTVAGSPTSDFLKQPSDCQQLATKGRLVEPAKALMLLVPTEEILTFQDAEYILENVLVTLRLDMLAQASCQYKRR